MSQTTTAHPLPPSPLAEPAVHWFGESQRKIAGRPDTRYGWLAMPEGPCIVKALDTALTSYSTTLLRNERDVLQRLGALGAPVPQLISSPEIAAQECWLVTRFAGVSLQLLQRRANGGAGLAFDEWLSAWIHFLQRARAFDEAGAVPIDLWSANLVLPLSHGIEGQAQLGQPVLIDHAHTVVAGMNLRRPVWMHRHMRRVAPELREALQADQETLVHAFRLARADLPGYESPTPDALDRTRRLWAEYDAPQQLQRLLDSGRLSRGAAIQYAVGVALDMLANVKPFPYASDDAALRLAPVLQRLMAPQPQARYDTLDDAARALRQVLRAVPLASERRFGPVQPADLMGPGGQAEAAKREESRHWPTAMPQVATARPAATSFESTAIAGSLVGEGTIQARPSARPAPMHTALPPDADDTADEVIDITASTAPRQMAPAQWRRRADGLLHAPARPVQAETVQPRHAASPPTPAARSGLPLWLYLVAAAGAAVGALLPPLW